MGMLKKIWELIWGKNLVVYKLRKYLRKLYEGYPSYWYFGYEDTNRELRAGIPILIEDEIIKKHQTLNRYRLTAEGLRLVENWNTERIALIGIIISLLILLFTVDGLYITVLNYLK